MNKKKKQIKPNQNPNQNYNNKIIGKNSPFAVNEAFKTLRTNLTYTTNGERCPVFGITSSAANEGKSLIISNLAVSFAQMDKKVLLIGADMRCPVLHKIFQVSKSALGLSELLSSVEDINQGWPKYVTDSGISNLTLLTSGRVPPNPSELLASGKMNEFIETAKQNFDIVLIDLPPICAVSDASVVAPIVTGYMLVVRSEVTSSTEVSNALDALERVGANVIGFVFNDVNPKINSYKKRSYYRYRYRYRYGSYNNS